MLLTGELLLLTWRLLLRWRPLCSPLPQVGCNIRPLLLRWQEGIAAVIDHATAAANTVWVRIVITAITAGGSPTAVAAIAAAAVIIGANSSIGLQSGRYLAAVATTIPAVIAPHHMRRLLCPSHRPLPSVRG